MQTEHTQQHSTANILPHLTVKWKFMGTQLPGVTSVLACRRAVEREAPSNYSASGGTACKTCGLTTAQNCQEANHKLPTIRMSTRQAGTHQNVLACAALVGWQEVGHAENFLQLGRQPRVATRSKETR